MTTADTTARHDRACSNHRPVIERVITTMRQRMGDDLCLDELAGVANMSPYHFNRTFRRMTGIPPSQFLSALRLEEAKRLLLVTDRPVTEICFQVGYGSLGTFTTRFRQLVGLAPGQFRQLGRAFTTHPQELAALSEPPPSPSEGPLLSGRVRAGNGAGMVFMGLFETAIPQGRPVACAILPRPGAFRLRIPAEGCHHLFAAGLSHPESPIDFLRQSVRGLASAGPFEAPHEAEIELVLRPPDLLDPPLLVTLPLLIDERLTERLGIPDEEMAL